MGTRKVKFIIYCVIFTLINLFPLTPNFIYRYFINGILFYFLGLYLVRNNPYGRKGHVMIFGPFLLLYFIALIDNIIQHTYPVIPIFLITAIATFLVHKVYRLNLKKLVRLSTIYVGLLIGTTLLLPNYYHYLFDLKSSNNELSGKSIPDLVIYDEDGDVFDMERLRGKISIFDVWTSTCGVCIKNFPKYDKVREEFKNKPNIDFYSLNLPIRKENRDSLPNFTNPFSFTKLYADKNVKSQLMINEVPQYIIIDPELNIRYVGALNTTKVDFYNNFYKIIQDIELEYE